MGWRCLKLSLKFSNPCQLSLDCRMLFFACAFELGKLFAGKSQLGLRC